MAFEKTSAWVVAFAVTAALALAGAAAAQALVPPGNSAVNQYTETYPTAGGSKGTRPGRGGNRSPAQALGEGNARRLEAQGPAGEAAAVVAALTTPVERGGDSAAGKSRGGQAAASSPLPDGSSGVVEVIEEATGLSSSEGPSAILPLVVLATALWALAFLWRRKRSA